MSQINPVHAPHLTSTRSIIILSSHLRLGLPSGLFPSRLPTKTLYARFLSPIRTTCPVHYVLLYLIGISSSFLIHIRGYVKNPLT